LWPEEDPGVARPRLYVRLSQLRRMLDPEDPQAHIQSVDGGGYRLETQPQWWVDVDAFEAAAEQGRDAQEAGAIADAIAAYEEARRLYRGDFLEEERYVDWALGERERLLERYLTLLTELAEAYAQQGRYRRAIALYQRVLDRDPYREAVFTRLMLTYAHAGEQTQALRAFERCRRLLIEEMGVEPLPATQALAERIRTGALWADDDGLRYPPPAYDGRLFDIPYSLAHTPFVGREREYAWLVSRWQQARPGLVLVEGEAGVGKTRLVEEMLGFVERQGARVLRTPPLPEGTALPYAPLIEGLRPLWHPGAASGLPGLHRRTLDTFFASESEGALHPSFFLSERSVGREGAPATSSIEHAISGWLQAQVPPETLLFIDDGPRLDTDSLALIEALARGLTVIVTARTDELPRDHPLRVAFHILAQAQQADHLRVGRLSEASVSALVQQLAGGDATDLIAQVASRTGGNPLFTVAKLQTFFE
ncbi:MAG: BTAD domain-containing putative transcriptional regulator, partial [Anaerolineae bacterium]